MNSSGNLSVTLAVSLDVGGRLGLLIVTGPSIAEVTLAVEQGVRHYNRKGPAGPAEGEKGVAIYGDRRQ